MSCVCRRSHAIASGHGLTLLGLRSKRCQELSSAKIARLRATRFSAENGAFAAREEARIEGTTGGPRCSSISDPLYHVSNKSPNADDVERAKPGPPPDGGDVRQRVSGRFSAEAGANVLACVCVAGVSAYACPLLRDSACVAVAERWVSGGWSSEVGKDGEVGLSVEVR